ncbi:hypothetical protein DRE_02643 [Drechslerella stenobrocha 248]|uniref:Uncharacterized protein n=1 Tax=Drechslerella stenobrocha 248 TaxID=1043628 RepID=W7HWZ6_9PEZI|nr:hypothetical protein DRE_02643 [Drechslerella stenobrocha 248]
MDRISLSRASRAFYRSSKNLRDSSPPSPDRKALSRLSRSSRQESQMKFQISAPVELLSSTSMISYTSQSLRNPSPTGRSASAIGHVQLRERERAASPAGGRASPIPRTQTANGFSHHHHHKSLSYNQPPSPASTTSGGSSAGPLSPDIGVAISDVLTPPATPPPENFHRLSRSSSVGPKPLNPLRKSSNSVRSKRNSNTNTTTTATTTASTNTMDFQQRLQRIKSTSSLSSRSSVSNTSSGDNYRLEYGNYSNHHHSSSSGTDEFSNVPTTRPSPDLRRTSSSLGPRASYKAPTSVQATPRTSGLSRSPSSGSSYSGSSSGVKAQQPAPAAPVVASPSIPPPPPRVSARRSASNPNLRAGTKRSNKGNPFAHELAQVSELAEDMGLDLVDNDVMVKKGLLKFSAKDYLAAIRDISLFPAAEEAPAPPVVPIRRKPSIFRTEKLVTAPVVPVAAPVVHVAAPVVHAPKPVAGQRVAVGGWI